MGIVLAMALMATVGMNQGGEVNKIEVDPRRIITTWEGWGTSLCWWAASFGDREDIADLLFTTKDVEFNGQRIPGLGMTIARYNAGGSSNSEVDGLTMVTSPHLAHWKQIAGFWLNPSSEDPNSRSWDWTVDPLQRKMLLMAKQRGANRFELFSNSPMWWMCTNRNPCGNADAKVDNLRSDMRRLHSVYMATVAERAKKKWGITFTSIDPFNEPDTDYWHANGNQEGCHFSPKSQALVLDDLRRELDTRNLRDLPIAASDETYYDIATRTWESFDQTTKDKVGRVNVHGYQGDGGDRDKLRQAIDGKPRWNSEYGEEQRSGQRMSRSLCNDFHQLHISGWCYWQPFDITGWGLVESDLGRKEIRTVNPKYFVLAQYSRHIRPGMEIIGTDNPWAVAAYDPGKKKLVVVLDNHGEEKSTVLDLTGFGHVGAKGIVRVSTFDGFRRYERMADVTPKGKSCPVKLPAGSVVTVEFDRIAL